jgi:hypothetical protein
MASAAVDEVEMFRTLLKFRTVTAEGSRGLRRHPD